jgi:hypothetical protein
MNRAKLSIGYSRVFSFTTENTEGHGDPPNPLSAIHPAREGHKERKEKRQDRDKGEQDRMNKMTLAAIHILL